MATRTQVRTTVMQMLYGSDLGNALDEDMLDDELECNKIKNDKKIFGKELFRGTVEYLEEIDIIINKHLKDWDFSRIGYIERAIFRLGTYEILYGQNKGSIVINDLVSISKQYCPPSSINFINGVLNAIYKNIDKDNSK